ncbi:Amidohydrolase family protein [Sulfidibacter corallicola]|uniref:Amidohydrolase family protein n=1 Tax=Sulfidibacter corallicola TaxID=2818388 RepID=A0A8A4TH32_SULCO|nr:amidohydrolase family protein [Sulfidibacter corallicola]QTD48943.1 amidohydrolase family protein [Sulfidibacter corallicola]
MAKTAVSSPRYSVSFAAIRCRFPTKITVLGLVLSMWLLTPPLWAQTVIYAGTLIDGTSDKPRNKVTIVIEDGKITGVSKGYLVFKKADRIIDLKSATVMPGLIDLHTHLSFELGPESYTEKFTQSTAEVALRSGVFAERTLMAGFTTVRDLGDRDNVTVVLRDNIQQGWVVGPRIFTSGKSLATTGGHADPTNGYRRDKAGDPGPREGVINGGDDARKAVRHRYKDGADLIKITATGGVLSVAKSGHNPQFTEAELEAVVGTANDYGFHVAAHAHGTEGIVRAVRAGVLTIEHGTFLNEEAMVLMKEKGAYLVPTLLAGDTVVAMAKQGGALPPVVAQKALEVGRLMRENFAKAYEMGVPIAFGTDSGVSKHGMNAREFGLMVNGGMPAMTAIQSATSVAAKVLDEPNLGTVAKGAHADLIAVEGNPLEDIAVLEKVAFVMKAGQVYKENGAPARSP